MSEQDNFKLKRGEKLDFSSVWEEMEKAKAKPEEAQPSENMQEKPEFKLERGASLNFENVKEDTKESQASLEDKNDIAEEDVPEFKIERGTANLFQENADSKIIPEIVEEPASVEESEPVKELEIVTESQPVPEPEIVEEIPESVEHPIHEYPLNTSKVKGMPGNEESKVTIIPSEEVPPTPVFSENNPSVMGGFNQPNIQGSQVQDFPGTVSNRMPNEQGMPDFVPQNPAEISMVDENLSYTIEDKLNDQYLKESAQMAAKASSEVKSFKNISNIATVEPEKNEFSKVVENKSDQPVKVKPKQMPEVEDVKSDSDPDELRQLDTKMLVRKQKAGSENASKEINARYEKSKRKTKIWIAVACICLCACGGFAYWQYQTQQNLVDSETKAKQIQSEIENLQSQLAELENNEESLKKSIDEYMNNKAYNRVLQLGERIHNEYPDTETDEYAQKLVKEAKEALEELGIPTNTTEEEVSYSDYQALSYNKLVANSKSYRGEKAKFYGKIVQLEDGKDSDITVARLAVDGDLDNILVVQWEKSNTIDVSEGDYINTGGIIVSDLTYKTVLGTKITVPAMSAVYVTKVE